MKLKNEVYDALKWVVTVLLPALGALYASLGALWGFPAVEAVVGTLAAVALFLGALINRSTKRYNEGADGPELLEGE